MKEMSSHHKTEAGRGMMEVIQPKAAGMETLPINGFKKTKSVFYRNEMRTHHKIQFMVNTGTSPQLCVCRRRQCVLLCCVMWKVLVFEEMGIGFYFLQLSFII